MSHPNSQDKYYFKVILVYLLMKKKSRNREPGKNITTKEFSEQLLGMRDYGVGLDNA